MATVPIDHLSAGMVLKSSVCDRSGRLLLPEGAELTEKHLQIFRTWGILEAEVVGESDSETGGRDHDEISPEALAAAEAEMSRLFMHNDPEHPAIKELLRICIVRKATNVT